MRFALVICSFFILVIHKGSGAQYGFRPTPIPLTDWHDRRQGRASTLHETFRTDAPPTVAAVPAHYWEDALRHSVYLTLVRDKIDQLIAKGDITSAENYKPVSKEVDDHNLWEKIKTAPFDRIKAAETSVVGDVTVMAKGRLLEEKDGYRFAEDDKSQYCNNENCMQGVKAIWSVKRVRQRDQEISPGKYHYELTFSVISQPPIKKSKPYETPVRTFTVRESPSPFVGSNRAYDINRSPFPQHTPRPARAIWFHKNIVPQQQQTKRQHFGALDRIFSSLFTDDDERSYEPPVPRYKPHPYGQHAKVGYVGASSDQHQQVNSPHRYRPPQTNFGRPPYGPLSTIQQQQHHQQYHQPQHQYQPTQQQHQSPPQQPHQHFDVTPPATFNGHNYHSTHDRSVEPYSTVKTMRPAVLPTPLPPLSSETTSVASYESVENVTNLSDFTSHTSSRFKPTATKVSYFTDHVRPPIYNAPPGVFVTMDKKPFKPMPPLKLVHTNRHKNRPVDFRPSPQLHDHQIIDEDSFTDSAFRPINVAHNASSGFSDEIESNKKPELKHRKPTSQGKKPSKKHSSAKRVSSTAAPDIITAQAVPEEAMDAIYWTNVLNSFTKTTPMSSQLEKDIVISTVGSTEETSSLSTSSLGVIDKITTTPTVKLETTSAPTSPKPRKRTRPPPMFTKPEKVRKHKRITTSSTTTTPTPRHTPAPRITFRSTESPVVRKTDLTPQASSAPTAQRNKTTSTTTTSTTTTSSTSTTTTSNAPTTTTKPSTTARPVTTTERKTSSPTSLPRNRNRFRQSTLLIKGTSVKHDRWSVIGIQKNNTTPATPSAASMSYRRKGSNFQGYSSTTPRNVEKESPSTQSNEVETSTNYDTYVGNSVIPLERSEEENYFGEDDEAFTSSDESGDNEYHGGTTTWASEKTNEVASESEEAMPTTGTNSVSQPPKKCKKKKIYSEADSSNDLTTTAQSTTSETGTDDILSEILKFNYDNDIGNDTKSTSDVEGQASINHGSYQKMDGDLKDFFDILNDKPDETFSGPEASFDDHYGDDDKEFEGVEDRDNDSEDDDDDYDSDDNVSTSTRQSKSKSEKPFSFLDLLV